MFDFWFHVIYPNLTFKVTSIVNIVRMMYGCVCGPQKFISHTFFILALIRWALSPLEKDIKLFGGKFYSLFASESLI